MKDIRVRFAPSPTGPLHIGGVRTALYNYLFARKNNGKMILRIEDTDQNRYVEGAEDYIIESLDWCGIQFDEGVGQGGAFAPYRQSERKTIYKEYALRLVESGHAYYAFDTPEELEAMRKKLEAEKAVNTSYSPASRNTMKNSLRLEEAEVTSLLNSGEPYIIRFKTPENEVIVFEDLIRGEITVKSETLDDKVLFKSDGMPTYHLANVVDDYLMKISHVIRGEEWLPSLALHVLLYRAFGWDKEMPQFAHLPLILKPDGKGKLSKRDGDRLGFPVFPIEWKNPENGEVASGYRESGYFQEAFINILALLGWNPGTEQELFSMNELIQAFSLDRVGKSGSRFDPEKAKWFNHQYLLKKEDAALVLLFQKILQKKGFTVSDEFVGKVISLIKERSNFVDDFWDQSYFFFQAPGSYDPEFVKKRWKENTPEILMNLISELSLLENFSSENLEKTIHDFLDKNQLGMGQVMNALRLTIIGSGRGPGMFDVMELLGKEEVINRINKGLQTIK